MLQRTMLGLVKSWHGAAFWKKAMTSYHIIDRHPRYDRSLKDEFVDGDVRSMGVFCSTTERWSDGRQQRNHIEWDAVFHATSS
jgi:hypothetical protein